MSHQACHHHVHTREGIRTVQIAVRPSQPHSGRIRVGYTGLFFKEYRPEPVASESIVFLSEKMMERSTSRSFFYDLADGES